MLGNSGKIEYPENSTANCLDFTFYWFAPQNESTHSELQVTNLLSKMRCFVLSSNELAKFLTDIRIAPSEDGMNGITLEFHFNLGTNPVASPTGWEMMRNIIHRLNNLIVLLGMTMVRCTKYHTKVTWYALDLDLPTKRLDVIELIKTMVGNIDTEAGKFNRFIMTHGECHRPAMLLRQVFKEDAVPLWFITTDEVAKTLGVYPNHIFTLIDGMFYDANAEPYLLTDLVDKGWLLEYPDDVGLVSSISREMFDDIEALSVKSRNEKLRLFDNAINHTTGLSMYYLSQFRCPTMEQHLEAYKKHHEQQ